jgi:hypothetical protein
MEFLLQLVVLQHVKLVFLLNKILCIIERKHSMYILELQSMDGNKENATKFISSNSWAFCFSTASTIVC